MELVGVEDDRFEGEGLEGEEGGGFADALLFHRRFGVGNFEFVFKLNLPPISVRSTLTQITNHKSQIHPFFIPSNPLISQTIN
jgi:hypothetical protein